MRKQSLALYRHKRDFNQTTEPNGTGSVAKSARLRFVVQKHAARRLHFDLRLELDGVFKSWAITRGPSSDPMAKRLAVEVEDHPLDYGDFEGTIPEDQYGGGTVQLWDRGYWQAEGLRSAQEALRAGDFKFRLEGTRLHGGWVLVRMKHDRYGGKRTHWLLIKHKDEYAVAGAGEALSAIDQSVASGRSMRQIAAGTGRAPKPFMRAKNTAVRADAVWNSKPSARSEQSSIALPKVAHLPQFIRPQLCKLVDHPPAEAGWGHEVKFDGYRAELRVVKGAARFRTRNGLDWTDRFAALAQSARHLPDCLIDGEVVALDHRRIPSFSALQAALSDRQSEDLIFFAFDLLFVRHDDLRKLPLTERKVRLEQLLQNTKIGDRIRYVEHLESRADAVLQSACKMGLEGIVSKRLDAAYISGRSDAWVKSKCRAGHEVVLGGWTTEAGTVRSLLAGVYRDGLLVYVGRIGTGYGREVAASLLPRLRALTRQTSPFGGANAPAKEKKIRWLDPVLVAEIEFAGWTASDMIRQAAFKGLREDKPASSVVAETPTPAAPVPRHSSATRSAHGKRDAPAAGTVRAKHQASATRTARAKRNTSAARTVRSERNAPAGRTAGAHTTSPVGGGARRTAAAASVMGVSISKPDKALWPDAGDAQAVTKLDLAHYFEQVGPWMLPHIEGRPCSLVRAPDGFRGQQFFQRHAMAGMSDLFKQIAVKGDRAPYVQIDRVEALAAVAQMGGLEIHPWNCAPGRPEVAGRLVFDLDPAPDVKFSAVIAAALELRGRLEAVGLVSFCKTTGGKGLHVVTPLAAHAGSVAWPVAKNFAHVLCAQMATDSPGKYLDTMSKSQRVGRIFLDYLRNDRTSTAVAPLSPRARAGVPVSMPLDWKAVSHSLDPAAFTLRTVPALLRKSSAWSDYDRAAMSLRASIAKLTAAHDASRNASVKSARKKTTAKGR